MAFLNQLETIEVTIANGASLSGAAALAGKAVVGILGPAAWTAAAMSFDVSVDGTTFVPYCSQTAEVSIASAVIATAAPRFFGLSPAEWIGFHSVKVRSGLKGSEVNQGAARTLTLVVRPV